MITTRTRPRCRPRESPPSRIRKAIHYVASSSRWSLRAVENRGQHVIEEAEVEWLWHIAESAALQRFGGERHLLVGGYHDHGDRLVDLLDGLEHLDAAHAGHLDVEEDHIGPLATDSVERVNAVERDLHVVVDLEVLPEDFRP